jgi:deoxyribonuclease-4
MGGELITSIRKGYYLYMTKVGVHTSIAGGLHKSLIRAHGLGCTTVQIFSHNPRGWKTNEIHREEIKLFINFRKKLDISPVYVHASYLINIASSSKKLRARSVALLKEEMRRADVLGADFVVLHTGSAHDGQGLQRAVKSIIETFKDENYNTGLLIENTSGKRGDIASTMIEMSQILKKTDSRLSGICIDTCHAHAAGYDLTLKNGRDKLIKEIKELIGIEKLKLIHLNDSKGEVGTGIDRHEHIGLGKIGAEALGSFVRHVEIKDIPLILETPKKSDSDDARNLTLTKKLIGEQSF